MMPLTRTSRCHGAAGGASRPDSEDSRGAAQTAGHQVRALHRCTVTGADHARRTESVHGPRCRHAQDGRTDRPQHVLSH